MALNARDAADRGADIHTRTRCVAARRDGDHWRVTLENARDGSRFDITARGLVNAAGPWVSEVLTGVAGLNAPARDRLVKGSHIVVDRIFDHDRAYIFQNADGRICFAIPYERDFTLIGTTDEEFEGDPADGRDQRAGNRLSARRGQRVSRKAGHARRHPLDLCRGPSAL